ncbi:hypothetical protein PsYK624_063040 [Phanerochaete sordida]|uniref:Uncharacterized protein n=1 Tax=Phanerochaete sordida TaxID=48140 RepID=A0A9P3LDB8_9APHY|nr:hypothetical protein PsYK624_063040 [Phanerochaete sordida]
MMPSHVFASCLARRAPRRALNVERSSAAGPDYSQGGRTTSRDAVVARHKSTCLPVVDDMDIGGYLTRISCQSFASPPSVPFATSAGRTHSATAFAAQ